MATAEEGFMKKLAVYATLAVLAHAVIVVWHLFVLAGTSCHFAAVFLCAL